MQFIFEDWIQDTEGISLEWQFTPELISSLSSPN
jgi:hypothetical protein